MNTKNQRTFRVLAGSVGVFFVFVVGIAVWSAVKEYPVSSYEAATHAYRSGDMARAIAVLDEMIRRDARTDETQPVIARRFLAQSLFLRDREGDRVRAIELLREIVENPAATPAMRAAALNDMTGLYIASEDRWIFAKRAIFQGDLFGGFLRDDGVPMAMKRMIEYGYDLHPTPDAVLYMAYWYASSIRSSRDAPKDEYVPMLLKWLNEGEKFFSGEKKFRPEVYSKEELAQLYFLDAEARMVLAPLASKDSPTMMDGEVLVEQAYQRALSALMPEDDFQSYQQGLVIRFRYASFLASAYGDARADEIRSLVDPIVRAPRKFAPDDIVTPIERIVRGTKNADLERIAPSIWTAVQ